MIVDICYGPLVLRCGRLSTTVQPVWVEELEENDGTSGYDWIGYRKVGLSGSRGCRDGRCRHPAAPEPRQRPQYFAKIPQGLVGLEAGLRTIGGNSFGSLAMMPA